MRTWSKQIRAVLAVLGAILLLPLGAMALTMDPCGTVPAGSTCYDLTTGTTVTINGADYSSEMFSHPTGTGVFDPFLRLGKGNAYPVEEGYNTDGRAPTGPKLDQDQYWDPNYTHALQLSSLVAINGFYVFELDIDQRANTHNQIRSYLSLDELQLFQEDSGDLRPFSTLTNKVYDLDTGGDNYLVLDYLLRSSGQGTSDMFLYIPVNLFDMADGDYVYLYSRFGENWVNNDGPEEWRALMGSPVPEPTTLILFSMGLLSLAAIGRRARRCNN